MDAILSAILNLLGLSTKAYKQGRPEMGSDFLEASLKIAQDNDVNINKIIQELQRNPNLDSSRKADAQSSHLGAEEAK